jgi:hypothetical protein
LLKVALLIGATHKGTKDKRNTGMTTPVLDLPGVIKEIEEIDACITDLNADARHDPDSKAARHNKFAVKALRRYRERLVDERDVLLAGLGGT